jgi:cytochrome P450
MSHPNPSVFESSFQDTHISVKHIVNEALRLYPPTRRIHRELNNEMVKINVEWLHRDPVSWGRGAEEFKPERWVGVLLKGVDGKMAFTPFGLGEFSCPAKKFAPMVIGILVGALMVGVGEGWEVVDEKLSGDVLGTKVLDGGREVYEGLRLRRFNAEE